MHQRGKQARLQVRNQKRGSCSFCIPHPCDSCWSHPASPQIICKLIFVPSSCQSTCTPVNNALIALRLYLTSLLTLQSSRFLFQLLSLVLMLCQILVRLSFFPSCFAESFVIQYACSSGSCPPGTSACSVSLPACQSSSRQPILSACSTVPYKSADLLSI